MYESASAKRFKSNNSNNNNNNNNQLPLDFSLKSLSKSEPEVSEVSERLNYDSQQEDDLVDDNNVFASANIANKLLALEYELTKRIELISFDPPVEYVYSPIDYAISVHANFLQKYCHTTKKILFLAMNPGPWGMSQTGIPFGEINAVVNWLKLSGLIEKPLKEQPNRKGSKLKELRDICDLTLLAVLKLLEVEKIVGIGRFAEQRAKNIVKTAGLPIRIFWMPHPSPRSTANENWSDKALKTLNELDLLKYFVKSDDENVN
ncbi:Similar to smug1: Single-strand selective monofunctional uracil DNA glycosylase (Xenopus laevis) [Cotesia congregata]|uniref:Similar to smug1: Single-strand selective monofunctional uracil DNA glycosylase (Xenopus laevis) n=1 Tax=Cotesia congregata TaxID=51543 RepID=A0A8J2H7Y0_COTCN|nr:Similar to smug1: Single-strand selective monofunctional uracil DNA glycosylase (Xenopus laevis) [Cotesia congregata]